MNARTRLVPALTVAVLLAAATLAGLMVSWLLLWLGLEAPFLRFPIAVLSGYAFFLLLVDIWLAYLGIKRSEAEVSDPGGYPLEGGSPECAAAGGSDAGIAGHASPK